MDLRIILLLFISHLLGDFAFQSKNVLKLRVGKTLAENIKGNIIHSFVHFILMIIVLFIAKDLNILIHINYMRLFILALVIAIIHFFIDELKSYLIKIKPSLEISILLFLFDQVIHFIAIIIVTFSSINYNVILFDLYTKNMDFTDRLLISIIVFLLGTFFSGIFIKKFITFINFSKYRILVDKGFFIFGRTMEVKGGIANGGFIIGILERIFIMIVIAIGEPSMVGFALTAKSIARFKKLDDSSFAEYFLIGTFISFILAIGGGIAISTLNVFPIIK